MLCIIAVPSFPLLLNVLLWNKPQLIMPFLVCHIGLAQHPSTMDSASVGIWVHVSSPCTEDLLITYTGGWCLDHGETNFSLIWVPVTVCRASHWLFHQQLSLHCTPSLQGIRFSFFGLMVLTDATQWWHKRLDFEARLKSRPTLSWTWRV